MNAKARYACTQKSISKKITVNHTFDDNYAFNKESSAKQVAKNHKT